MTFAAQSICLIAKNKNKKMSTMVDIFFFILKTFAKLYSD